MRLTEEKLRTTWAFWIEYNVDPRHRGPLRGLLSVFVPFNCYGEPIETRLVAGAQSSIWATWAPGAEKYFPDYIVRERYAPSKHPGVFIDIRTLDMMLGGCCPEELNAEQLGGEESQD